MVGDARQLGEYVEVTQAPFDLLLTDPPYAQMMAKPKTGERKKQGRGDATPFTIDSADLGNLEYHEFLAALRGVLAAGLDRAAFEACRDTGRFRRAIHEALEEARRYDVSVSPSFLVNGRLAPVPPPFLPPFEFFTRLVEEELVSQRK